jgi:hypothetical protein
MAIGRDAKSPYSGLGRLPGGMGKRLVQRLQELPLEQVELLRPGRGATGDRHHAVALGYRLGLGRDGRASGPCPGALHGPEQRPRLGLGLHPAQRISQSPRDASPTHAATEP